jgi:hypothetical protein
MEDQVKDQVKMCSCGRVRTHCPKCGKKPTYYKKTRSMDLSLVAGRRIEVYRCAECGDFTSENECHASKLTSVTEPVRQDNMVLGSNEHAFLLRDWVLEMQRKNKWGSVQVYIEAQKAGWHLEAFGDKLDEDVKQALIERGLLPSAGDGALDPSQSGRVNEAPSPTDSLLAAEAPVSIEDIIEAMNKEQRGEESK